MGNVELKDVVCVLRKVDMETELVHVALTVDEAKKYISEQARAVLKEMNICETTMKVYEDGVEIYHMCDIDKHLHDFHVRFYFQEHYAKLLVGG